jgi:type I restriction enzyme, S subunit
MSCWLIVPLGEVMHLALDPYQVDPNESYPIAGVYGFGRGMLSREPIFGRDTAANQLFKIRSGQLIYSKLKAFEGAFAIVDSKTDGYFVSNEFPTFDINPAVAMPGYIRWYFRQKSAWNTVSIESQGIGARRERLHPDALLRSTIPLPPLDEQYRIVQQLDGVSDQISRRQNAAKVIEAELAATLRAAFDRIVTGVPRARMGDVAPVVRRPVEIDPEGIYAEIGARSFGRGLFEKPNLIGGDLTWQKLFRIEAGDIVFSNIKAWEGAFAVARSQHHGKVGSHRYITCVPDLRQCTPDFLWYFLQSPSGIEQVQAASPGSADRNRTLSQKGLEETTVPLPSLDAQQWFDRLQAKAQAARAAQAAASTDLDHLLPALLGRVFS